MKTVLVFVVALVLGALLAYYLVPRTVEEPSKPPPPGPVTQVKATHEAAVVVDLIEDRCAPKTYPPVLCGRVGDDFVWKIVVANERCADYVADLQIEEKAPAQPGEVEIRDPAPGPERKGTVRELPTRCVDEKPCPIPYAVIVKSTDTGREDLREDPRIDIW